MRKRKNRKTLSAFESNSSSDLLSLGSTFWFYYEDPKNEVFYHWVPNPFSGIY